MIVAGIGVRALVSGEAGFGNYADVVGEYSDLGSWLADPTPADADVVVAGSPTVFPDTLDTVREALQRCGASRAVLVYEFAQTGTLEALEGGFREITALRSPVTASELREACEADIALATLREHEGEEAAEELEAIFAEIPPRQFSDAQLAKISQISTTIDCECPHHLAALLGSLNAFERYSSECENRNEQDAILHGYLHRSTAKARSTIEDALVVLAEAEGLDIE